MTFKLNQGFLLGVASSATQGQDNKREQPGPG